jgi:hypothetical protein
VGIYEVEATGPDRIVVGRRMRRWARAATLAFAVLYIARAAIVRDAGAVGFAVMWMVLVVAGAMRPVLAIDAQGIALPALRARRIRWDQVASVIAPTRFDSTVSIELVDGRRRVLPGLDKALASRVADIGGKALSQGPKPVSSQASPAAPQRPTPKQDERDLQRRAAALQKQSMDLQAQFADIQRLRPLRNSPPSR